MNLNEANQYLPYAEIEPDIFNSNDTVNQKTNNSTFHSYYTLSENINELNSPSTEDEYYLEDELNKHIRNVGIIPSQNFSLLHINARSLHRNFDSLNTLINNIEHKFSIIGVTETWLNSQSNLINLDNYEFIFKGREGNKTGGGVGFYIKDDSNYKMRHDLTTFNQWIESIFIELNMDNTKNIIVGTIYRPPKQDIKHFLENLELLTSKIAKENKSCYLLGDFNLDLIKADSNDLTNQFLDILFSSGFIPLITKPTRVTSHSATLIDNIFTNILDDSQSVNGLLCTEIADHIPIFHIRKLNLEKNKPAKSFNRVINNKNMDNFVSIISKHSWSISNLSPNDAYNQFYSQLIEVYDKCFPIKKNNKQKCIDKPWITAGFKKSIKQKNKLYKKFVKSPTVANERKFKAHRNKLNSLLRLAKQNHYKFLLDKSKSSVSDTWKVINSLLKTKKDTKHYPKTFQINNNFESDPKQISDSFVSYFSNVGINLSNKIPDTNKSIDSYLKGDFRESCFFNPTDSGEIEEIVLSLKNKSSCGHDEINIKVIKHSIKYLSKPLSKLINLSLENGSVPDSLKIAKVIPIYKSGDKDNCTNYRPISVLPCISKIYEKVIYKRLTSYLDLHNILNKNQYGFRNNRSTIMAVTDFIEQISTSLDQGSAAVGVFLDLSKAFDTIDHKILLDKLYFYGIRGTPHLWLKNYLENRKQFVDFNGTQSHRHNITCGVPQGSILGPLLFLIYINDVSNSSEILKFSLFADDTNILYETKNLRNPEYSINKELAKLSLWFKTNKLTINVKKTNYMIFSPSKKRKLKSLNIKIDDSPLNQVNETKFLGIIIDNQLTWKSHISYVSSKVSKSIGIICRLKFLLNKSTLKTLYFSLVYPYLFYGAIIWGNTYNSRLERLRILQKKIIRIITNSPYLAHTNPLYSSESILKLDDIIKLEIATFMYLVENNQAPSTFENVFKHNNEIHSHNTRQSKKFHTISRRTKLGQFSISYMGPLVWNEYNHLQENCKNIYRFKKLMKNELLLSYN